MRAMQERDVDAVGRATTSLGLNSLRARWNGENGPDVLERWGKIWAAWPVRWGTKNERTAEARIGPEVKEHLLRFVRTSAGWKLDEWQPGQ